MTNNESNGIARKTAHSLTSSSESLAAKVFWTIWLGRKATRIKQCFSSIFLLENKLLNMARFPTAFSYKSSLALHSLTWWKLQQHIIPFPSFFSLLKICAAFSPGDPEPKRLLPCDHSPLFHRLFPLNVIPVSVPGDQEPKKTATVWSPSTVSSPKSIACYFCFCVCFWWCRAQKTAAVRSPIFTLYYFFFWFWPFSYHLMLFFYFIWFTTHLVFNIHHLFPFCVITYDEPMQCVHVANFLWSQYLTAFCTHSICLTYRNTPTIIVRKKVSWLSNDYSCVWQIIFIHAPHIQEYIWLMLWHLQGTTDYIYCKDGQCQFVTQVTLSSIIAMHW